MKYIIFYIILFCLFTSCKGKNELQNKKNSIHVKKSIFIHLDSLTNVVFSRVQYESGKIIILNNKQNSLDFYNFKDGEKLQKRIFLKKEGEDNVGVINDFLVYTPDSIFVLNCYHNMTANTIIWKNKKMAFI